MTYTLGTAAKATGISKTAIKRSIERGRISAKKNEFGHWAIDPAELHRVYPPITQKPEDNSKQDNTNITSDYRVLQGKLEALERENALYRQQLEKTETDKEHWRQQATRLLTHQQERKNSQEPPEGRIAKAWAALTGKI